MDSESKSIQEARSGSDEAFRQLVRSHQAAVQGYIGRYVRELDLVEDLAQETFLKAYQSLVQFRGESSFRVWLFAIARNEALMYLRQERTRRAHEAPTLRAALDRWLAERVESETSSPDAQERRLLALETCIKSLPERSASILEDHYVKGQSIGRIARGAGKSEVAVRVMLLRIRQALRGCIQMRLSTTGANS